MYTRCPECTTIFRVTAEQLRMAHGDVRCGNCTKSFNALLSLMDQRPPGDDAVPEITQQAPVSESEEELEFNAPEQSWTSFFMTADPAPVARPPEALEPATEEEQIPEKLDEPLEEHTGEHEEWRGMLSELPDDSDDDDGPLYSVGEVSDVEGVEDDEPTNEHPIITLAEETNHQAEQATPPPVEEAATDDEDSQSLWVLEQVDGETPAPDIPTVVSNAVDSPAPITQFTYGDYASEAADEGSDENAEDDLPPWIGEERLDEAFPETKTASSPRLYAVGAFYFVYSLLSWFTTTVMPWQPTQALVMPSAQRTAHST